jgi:formylglycine-generating enzyme required for sulfatase activity
MAEQTVAAPITVPVGNLGNPPDQDYGAGRFGAVPHGYRIAIREVTNAEYALFLNFKADSGDIFNGDPYRLYNSAMQNNARGGIKYTPCGFLNPGCGVTHSQSGYQPKPNMGDKPVNFVSWYDAIRYVNFLNNGGNSFFSSTETGAYNLGALGSGAVPLNPSAITRNPNAEWFLPNENEWYKAAYHQPANAGGDSDGYWLSPTRSNVTSPVLATADSVGNINNPGADVMNLGGANWNGQTGNVTTVLSAGPLSASYYGTYDQGGNVEEWTESAATGGRVVRGGSWNGVNPLAYGADQRRILSPTYEGADVGFRIARLVRPPGRWQRRPFSAFSGRSAQPGVTGVPLMHSCRNPSPPSSHS